MPQHSKPSQAQVVARFPKLPVNGGFQEAHRQSSQEAVCPGPFPFFRTHTRAEAGEQDEAEEGEEAEEIHDLRAYRFRFRV